YQRVGLGMGLCPEWTAFGFGTSGWSGTNAKNGRENEARDPVARKPDPDRPTAQIAATLAPKLPPTLRLRRLNNLSVLGPPLIVLNARELPAVDKAVHAGRP